MAKLLGRVHHADTFHVLRAAGYRQMKLREFLPFEGFDCLTRVNVFNEYSRLVGNQISV